MGCDQRVCFQGTAWLIDGAAAMRGLERGLWLGTGWVMGYC